MATVVISNLEKSYAETKGPGIKVVHGINLEIRDREFMVLVGPSGCGKSTTLRMIAGLEEITGGTIAIDGVVVNNVLPKDRDIAMVFQNYALYPHMSVYENMAFGLKLRKFPKTEIEARVREASAMLGLDPYLDRKPKALSGGQRQRVAVGRAMVREPKAFLFDEPLSNLDAKLRVEMRAELRMLHRRLGATMVYVTHDQEEAMSLGDRVVVLKDGLIQQVAAPRAVYATPSNRFVAGFVGTPTMNMLEGTLATEPGRMTFTAGALRLEGYMERWKAVTGASPRPCTLGVRAEHVRLGAGPLQGTVEAVEHYGDRMDVVVNTAGHRLVARTGPDASLREGATLALGLDLAHAHLFEPGEAGARLA